MTPYYDEGGITIYQRAPEEIVEHLRMTAESVRQGTVHAGWGLLDEAADTIERDARRIEELRDERRAVIHAMFDLHGSEDG